MEQIILSLLKMSLLLPSFGNDESAAINIHVQFLFFAVFLYCFVLFCFIFWSLFFYSVLVDKEKLCLRA